jgi:hypothetical protein
MHAIDLNHSDAAALCAFSRVREHSFLSGKKRNQKAFFKLKQTKSLSPNKYKKNVHCFKEDFQSWKLFINWNQGTFIFAKQCRIYICTKERQSEFTKKNSVLYSYFHFH